jgi:RNA polymerase sigma factor (sigma-70 family)
VNSLTDQQLVQEYARNRSEAAFTEIVRRHVDLVYSAAMRMVRDAQLAEDVTQATFLALAQNAGRLEEHCVLSGWLHRTARNLAVKIVRSDVRRRAREQEAVAMNELQARKADDVWEHIAPHLDDALLQLREPDRSVLMLRYFERKSAQQLAEIMGTTPEAAQKRTNRAVERLRRLFAKRGVTVGAGGLVAIVSANAVQSAPAGLAASISTAAGSAATAAATAAITKTIAMTTTQKLLAAAVVAGCLVTPLWFEQNAQAKFDTQKKLLQERTDRLGELQTGNVALSNHITRATAGPELPPGELAELLRLRGRAGSLRKEVEASSKAGKAQSRQDMLASIAAEYNERIMRLKETFDAKPGEKIPEFQYLTDRNWRDLAWMSENQDNFTNTASNARNWAQNTFVNDVLHPALQQYAKDNNNQFPTDLSQLRQYFTTGVDDSVLQRWEIVPASQLAGYMVKQALGPGDDELIAPKAPVNPALDMPTVLALNKVTAFASRPPNVWVRGN